MNKKISVIIPSYNSGITIGRTLKGLLEQTEESLLGEIIVADSSDDETTRNVIARYTDPKIRMVDTGVKVIPAENRNRAAETAEGELLVFIDADAYPAPDWLEKIWEAYQKGAIVGGGSIEPAPFQKEDRLAMSQYFLQFNSFMSTGGERDVLFVTSCNLFCKRELFMEIGGFPGVRAAEDVLFCLEKVKAERVRFLPGAVVHHVFREDLKSAMENQALWGEYVFRYRKNFYDGFLYRGAIPLILLPLGLALKTLCIILRISGSGTERFLSFIKTLPLFLKGMFWWSRGYIKGWKETMAGGK